MEYTRGLKKDPNSHTMTALRNLGDWARLPVFGVRYADDSEPDALWLVVPLNDEAKRWIPSRRYMARETYAALMLNVRGYMECPKCGAAIRFEDDPIYFLPSEDGVITKCCGAQA